MWTGMVISFKPALLPVDFTLYSALCNMTEQNSSLFLHHLVNFLNIHIYYLYLKSLNKNLLLILHIMFLSVYVCSISYIFNYIVYFCYWFLSLVIFCRCWDKHIYSFAGH